MFWHKVSCWLSVFSVSVIANQSRCVWYAYIWGILASQLCRTVFWCCCGQKFLRPPLPNIWNDLLCVVLILEAFHFFTQFIPNNRTYTDLFWFTYLVFVLKPNVCILMIVFKLLLFVLWTEYYIMYRIIFDCFTLTLSASECQWMCIIWIYLEHNMCVVCLVLNLKQYFFQRRFITKARIFHRQSRQCKNIEKWPCQNWEKACHLWFLWI